MGPRSAAGASLGGLAAGARLALAARRLAKRARNIENFTLSSVQRPPVDAYVAKNMVKKSEKLARDLYVFLQ